MSQISLATLLCAVVIRAGSTDAQGAQECDGGAPQHYVGSASREGNEWGVYSVDVCFMKANATIICTVSFESTDRNSIPSYAEHLTTLHWDTKADHCWQDGGAQWSGSCTGAGQPFIFRNIDGDSIKLCPQTMADKCKGEGTGGGEQVSAAWSVAYGQGLWEARTAIPEIIFVQGHDGEDRNVTRCGAHFLMHMVSADDKAGIDACHVTGTEPNTCTECREVSWCSLGCAWGVYRFAYTAKTGGAFDLSITLDGHEVPGSPFKPFVVDAGIFLPGFELADAAKMLVITIFIVGLILITLLALGMRHHHLKGEVKKRAQMLQKMSEESEAFMGLTAGDFEDDDDFTVTSVPQVPFSPAPLRPDADDANDEVRSEMTGDQRLPNPLNPLAPFHAPRAFRSQGSSAEARPTSVRQFVNKLGIKL